MTDKQRPQDEEVYIEKQEKSLSCTCKTKRVHSKSMKYNVRLQKTCEKIFLYILKDPQDKSNKIEGIET